MYGGETVTVSTVTGHAPLQPTYAAGSPPMYPNSQMYVPQTDPPPGAYPGQQKYAYPR